MVDAVKNYLSTTEFKKQSLKIKKQIVKSVKGRGNGAGDVSKFHRTLQIRENFIYKGEQTDK